MRTIPYTSSPDSVSSLALLLLLLSDSSILLWEAVVEAVGFENLRLKEEIKMI